MLNDACIQQSRRIRKSTFLPSKYSDFFDTEHGKDLTAAALGENTAVSLNSTSADDKKIVCKNARCI